MSFNTENKITGLITMVLVVSTFFCVSSPVFAQEFRKRKVGNYKQVEVFAPIEIKIVDEHDVVQLYCKAKELTSVIMPLKGDEFIESIGTGDDEKVWSIAGKGSKVFTVKPSDLADRTSAIVRINSGKVFHFRLKNLTPDPVLFQANTAEEQDALNAYFDELATFDPYTVVVLTFREDQIQQDEEKQIQDMREALAEEISHYRQLSQEVQLAKAEIPEKLEQHQVQFTRAYAELIQFDQYDVDYKNRKAKKRYPVEKVFSDGTFTWVKLPDSAPTFHVYEVQQGKFEVVNFQVENNLYRIDRVVDQLEFRNEGKGDWLIRIKREG